MISIWFDFVCDLLVDCFVFKKYEVQLVKVYASNAVTLMFMRSCILKFIRNCMLPRPHVAWPRQLGIN